MHPLPDRTRADYVLCDRRGQALAVVEAKRASRVLAEAEPQALAYAAALKVPFVFLANGEEVRFRDLDRDYHFRPVATIFGQDELERWRLMPARRPRPDLCDMSSPATGAWHRLRST